MSSKKIIALRLCGPMQSWGFNSEYTYRNSGLFPTKSAVLGICCAAMGLVRGSDQEIIFLNSLSGCLMTAISLPRKQLHGKKSLEVFVRRIEDFHTVENTKKASGTVNTENAVLTYHQYICDADFIVLLENIESSIADQLEDKLADPKWGVWLGRKSCIPTAPFFAGKYNNVDEVSEKLLDEKELKNFTYQQEVLLFTDGVDTIMDEPLDFAIDKRVRSQRRIVTHEAEIQSELK